MFKKCVFLISISILISATTGCAYPQTRQERQGWDNIGRDLQSLGNAWSTPAAKQQECHTEYRQGPFGVVANTVCE